MPDEPSNPEQVVPASDESTFTAAPGHLQPQLTARPGDRFGRYKILEEIGQGGCGVVFVAEQEEPVRRRVALKVVKLGMDTRQVIARFEAERQALAMMEHPNIAKVLDAGATDTGRPFFVMELVKGMKITEYCDRHNLSTEDRLKLFLQVCQAVQHAHQKGIIHRDLKPSNVLVTLQDGPASAGVPKVIDFGIAKATADQKLTDKTVYTALEQFIGTPAYMSPEQAEMTGLDIDTRSDIYSLGVLLYELLIGETPFNTEELLGQGLDAMRRTLREQDPASPSTRLSTMTGADLTVIALHRQSDAPKLIKSIRGDLDWIVMKCLEKDRTRRYETANGLVRDIERHLANEPIAARPPSKSYRLQKLVRRNKLAFAAGTAVLLALLGGIAASTSQAIRANRSSAEARLLATRGSELAQQEQQQRQQAEQQRALADDRSRQLAHHLYASQMNVAFRSWEKGDISRTIDLLIKHSPQPGEEDLRGFEWYYLWRLCHDEQLTLRGHEAFMRGVAFSPDGRLLATAGDDSLVRIWDAESGKELLVLRGHTNWVAAVAFAPDGRTLVTGSVDQTIRLWDVTNGHELYTFAGHTQAVTAVAFSPTGDLIVSATGRISTGSGNPVTRFVDSRGFPAEVKLWQLDGRKEVATLTGHTSGILALSISPDGKTLATGSADQTVKLWEISTGNILTNLSGFEVPIFAVAFAPDGKSLAVGGGDPYQKTSELKLWDWSTGLERRAFTSFSGPVFTLAFSPDGKTLATAGQDQIIRLWDVNNETAREIRGHSGAIWSLAFNVDGKRLATASWDKTVKVWDATARQELAIQEERGYTCRFSPDGKYVVSGSRRLIIQELADTSKDFPLPDYETGDASIAFTPDGSRLVSAGMDQLVSLWEVGSWQPAGSMKGHEGKVWCLAVSPDSSTVATGSADTTVRLWDVKQRRERAVIRPEIGSIAAVEYTTDGRTLIVGSWNGLLFLDALSGEIQTRLIEPAPRIAVSPDGRFLAIGRSYVTGMKLLDLATRETKWEAKAHQDSIWSLRFSADSKTLATASWDGTAKLWNVASGQEMFTYNALATAWNSAFSPDGKTWAVGSSRGLSLFHGATDEKVEAQMQIKTDLLAQVVAISAPPSVPEPIHSTYEQLVDRLPRRNPAASPQLLDLTKYYNATLNDGWTDGKAENNLSALGSGLMTLGGVTFDVRGLIQLRCSKTFTESFPQEIRNIAVGRKCRKIHFLHAVSTSWGTEDQAPVGKFLIQQSGLPPTEVPIRFGPDVRDWWVHPKQQPVGVDPAVIAWRGTNATAQPLQLFLTTWTNLQPNVGVLDLHYISAMSTAAPFLVAITTED